MTDLLRAALRLENAFYEYRLGISTHGLYGYARRDWNGEEHLYYGTLSYRGLFQIFDWLALNRSDVVIDLGCGKGRVLCCASLYDVEQVIGVEDTSELCDVARNNLQRIRGRRASAMVIHGKAEDFDYVRGTVFYLYNPFGPNTLKTVVSQIGEGLRQNPRSIRVVYVNPRHDAVLEATAWLERYAQ
jgi:SAM-dependent methyltransferase